ncbi:MAG: hypothetical protein ACOYM8_17465 [Caulobacterales bacterium]
MSKVAEEGLARDESGGSTAVGGLGVTNEAAALCDVREGDWRRLDLCGFDLGRPWWRKALGIGSGCVAPGPVLLLGRRELRDDLLLGMLARYSGGVILVETGRLADRLARGPVYRFQPGAAASVGLDPLAVIRDGEMAWRDLMVLATELSGNESEAVKESVAAILGDHLVGSEPEKRTLTMLRRRLFDADSVLRAVMAGFEAPRSDRLGPLLAEMFRVRQSWTRFPESAHAAAARLSVALSGLADGTIASVLARRDFDCAELARPSGASTLIIAPLAGIGNDPLLSAVVGQALDAIVSEQMIGASSRRVALVFANAAEFRAPARLLQVWRDLADVGVDLVLAATTIEEAQAFVGAGCWADHSSTGAVFQTTVVAGPCAEADAGFLSARAGRVRALAPNRQCGAFALKWQEKPRLPPERIAKAPPSSVLVVRENQAPRCIQLDRPPSVSVSTVAHPIHATPPLWSEPALKRRAPAAAVVTPKPQPPPPPRPPIDVREALKAKSPMRRRPSI